MKTPNEPPAARGGKRPAIASEAACFVGLSAQLLGIHSRVIPEGRRLADAARGPLHTLRIVYRAHVTGGRLRNEVDGSTDRAEWFPMRTVRNLQRVRLVDIALRMAGEG